MKIAMNIIGPIFAVVVVLMLLYFGLGTTQTMMDDADANIDDGTALSASLNTSIELTEPAFNIMAAGVWILVLIFMIGGLYLLLQVI